MTLRFVSTLALFAVTASAQTCSNATYQGTYYSLVQGTVFGSPYFEMDKTVADGKGGLTGSATINSNGVISKTPIGSETYTVKPDCSGTQTGGNSPVAFQLIEGGREKLFTISSAGVNLAGHSYRAAGQCDTGALYGIYGVLYPSPTDLSAGSATFDGKGGYTAAGVPGTYSLSADCSGTASSGGSDSKVLAMVEGGKVLIMETDGDLGAGFLEPVLNPVVLGQFAFGGGWYSALYFTNSNNYAVSFQVNFVADDGTALSVPGTGSSTVINLAAQANSIIEAPDSGALSQGYVSLVLPPGVEAYGVFRQSVTGIADQEAVAPLASASSSQVSLTFDDTNYITAVAIVNPSALSNTVSIQVVDNTGAMIGTASENLPPNGKTEAVLRSLAGLSGMAGKRGTATFAVTSGNVAVLGLRFNGAAFTSIPATAH